MNSSHRTRLLLTAASYMAGALTGAVSGQHYYFPSPPMLSYQFVLADLRYAGAVGGALAGAFIAAFASRHWRRSGSGVSQIAAVWVFVSAGAIAYILLEGNMLAGATTLLALAFPWLVALLLLPSRRRHHTEQKLTSISSRTTLATEHLPK